MSWTQERMTTALSHLDAPTADEAFWERVHTDLLTRGPDLQEVTNLMSAADEPMTEVQPLVGPPRRVRWYAAAAAAAVVLVAGLYVIDRPSNQAPGVNPTRTDTVLTDPLSLTLDDEPRTAAPAVPRSEYVVPDVSQLQPGWTATEKTAFGIIWPPDNGYRVVYSLVSPSGESYTVDVFAAFSMKPDSGTTVDINGHDGLQATTQVWWEQQPGIEVTVSRAPGEGSPTGSADLVGAARSVVFATVRELPLVPIDPTNNPVRAGAQFAGTLSGISFTVATNAGPLRGIRVFVGDQGVGSVEEDRLSQPTDDPETEGSVNITGVPGYGVIAFGYTDPATAALRAHLADGDTVQVPGVRNPGETYFALPIPLGVEAITLDFLDVTGATLRTATMPSLPAYFGHCCAAAPWTTDPEPTSPPSTT